MDNVGDAEEDLDAEALLKNKEKDGEMDGEAQVDEEELIEGDPLKIPNK